MRLWMRVLRAGAVLSLLWLVAVALLHSQPYDPSLLLSFLLPPEGCQAPCLLGAQPGARIETAIEQLKTHAWIADVVESAEFYDIQWNGTQPDFINPDAANYLYVSVDRVQLVRLTTRMRLGDVILALGPPEGVDYDPSVRPSQYFIMLYPRWGLQVSAYSLCANYWHQPPWAFWDLPVEVRLEQRLLSYPTPDLNLASLRSIC